ncbi:unnamed protein product [Caenorhabditis nigoni]
MQETLRRQGVNTPTTKFLHNNAHPHVSKVAQQKIEEMGWESLPHPPNSPDLALSDFQKFGSMRLSLAEKHSKSRFQTEKWVVAYFESQPVEFFHSGTHSLRRCWRQVVDNYGE